MIPILLVYLLIINALAIALMLADKQKARKKHWRIPEAALLTVAVLGGSLGALMGMRIGHHKSLHLKFAIGLPLIFTAHLTLGIFLYTNLK